VLNAPSPPGLSLCHLIELVDRVNERHPHKAKSRFRHKLFSWLRRDLVRPSLNRPSQKSNPPAGPRRFSKERCSKVAAAWSFEHLGLM